MKAALFLLIAISAVAYAESLLDVELYKLVSDTEQDKFYVHLLTDGKITFRLKDQQFHHHAEGYFVAKHIGEKTFAELILQDCLDD